MLARGIESISCLLIVLMAFVFTSCATTNGDWEKAERLGTIKAYKTFLVEHPDADQADDARRRIEDILVDYFFYLLPMPANQWLCNSLQF